MTRCTAYSVTRWAFIASIFVVVVLCLHHVSIIHHEHSHSMSITLMDVTHNMPQPQLTAVDSRMTKENGIEFSYEYDSAAEVRIDSIQQPAAAEGSKHVSQDDFTGMVTMFKTARQPSAIKGSGKGILIVGDGKDSFARLFIGLRTLREVHKTKLPIEIVYYGQKEWDDTMGLMILDYANATSWLGRTSLLDGDSPQFKAPAYQKQVAIRGYLTKIHALCYVTSLAEVLYLDSDNLALLPPELIFRAPRYMLHSNLFWPDFWHHHLNDEASYASVGLRPPWQDDPDYLEAESGQILIDRTKFARVLDLVYFLNCYPPQLRGMYGDKDIFRMAFELMGMLSAYQQVHVLPRAALGPGNKFLGMVQNMGDHTPVFHHRAGPEAKYLLCSRKAEEAHMCRVVLITPPLSQAQMQGIQSGVDETTYQAECSSVAGMDNSSSKCNPVTFDPLRRSDHILGIPVRNFVNIYGVLGFADKVFLELLKYY